MTLIPFRPMTTQPEHTILKRVAIYAGVVALAAALGVAAGVLVSGCASGDEACGFEGRTFNATFLLVSGPCAREDEPKLFSVGHLPPTCTQQIEYAGCNPTVSRFCGDYRMLMSLIERDGAFIGDTQATDTSGPQPIVCRYNTELYPR